MQPGRHGELPNAASNSPIGLVRETDRSTIYTRYMMSVRATYFTPAVTTLPS